MRLGGLLLLCALACGKPPASRAVPSTAGDAAVEPVAKGADAQPKEGSMEPRKNPSAFLIKGTPVKVPDTDLTVLLVDYRYGRTVSDQVAANATIDVTGADGKTVRAELKFEAIQDVAGHRLMVTGSRSEVEIFVLPPE